MAAEGRDPGERYKVVRLLDELLPLAAKPQRSGVSFDLRLYLREDSKDGHLWGEVAFLDPDTGKLINDAENSLPLDRPDAIGEYFDHIARKRFPLAQRMQTSPGPTG